jgi:hypothetical protein
MEHAMATTGTDPGRVLDLVRQGLASTRAANGA